MKRLRIGKVEIYPPLILAPLSGVNCLPFRVLCRRYGAGMVCSQMVNVDDFIGNEDKLIRRYCDFIEGERPVAVQIIGAKPEKLAEAAARLQGVADIIDINFGCCDGAQLGKKAGCYFIKHPGKIYETVRGVKAAVKVPVTAKIRIGWDDSSINAVEVARTIEKAGADAIAVHARTRKDKYMAKARWEHIRAVKSAVSIPVIGNGDVHSPSHALGMLEKTGCDAVMIGRAAIGEPFFFMRARHFLEAGKEIPYQSPEQRFADFEEFLRLYEKQPRQRFPEIRNHAIWFAKHLRGAKAMKERIIKCEDIESIKKVFAERIRSIRDDERKNERKKAHGRGAGKPGRGNREGALR